MTLRPIGLALTALALVATACSSEDSQTYDRPEAAQSDVEAARAAALEAAGGQELGGTVTMLGVLGGEELDAYMDVLAPFEDATGVEVQYEGTRDFAAVLQTRVDGGNPPDLVSAPAIGEIAGLAEAGDLVDLRPVIGQERLAANFSPSMLETSSRDGELFGIFDTVNLGGLIWYNPQTYDGPTDPKSWAELSAWAEQKASDGETPWCVGLESGAASGWPAADFIDEILLRQAGPRFHQRWYEGEAPWTSPQVERAFETYGGMVSDGMVYGDTTTVLSTNFAKAANPMYTDSPGCYLLEQATFMGGIISDAFPNLEPGKDIDFFPAPDFSPQHPGIRSISGEIVGMLNQTPQSTALVKYLATEEAGTLIAASGRWLSPNQNVPSDAYLDPILRKASEILTAAKGTYSLGNALMPQTEVDAFWQAGLDYTESPDDLDAILERIQAARTDAGSR